MQTEEGSTLLRNIFDNGVPSDYISLKNKCLKSVALFIGKKERERGRGREILRQMDSLIDRLPRCQIFQKYRYAEKDRQMIKWEV